MIIMIITLIDNMKLQFDVKGVSYDRNQLKQSATREKSSTKRESERR